MDLIFVSMENWDEIWRRNQFVCAELAHRFPESKILFVGLARDFSNRIRRGKLRDLATEATSTIPDYPQITFTRPLKLLPNSLAIGRHINDSMARNHVAREAARIGMKAPLLWLNPHSALHMIGRMSESAAVYDITDDWISLTQSNALRTLTARQDAEMCARADAVIVCSQRLFDLKRPLARNLHLIPNGVDAQHYKRVLDGSGPLPAEAVTWKTPVFGYTGTIHPDRVDIPLVEQLATRMTSGSIVLVGPCHLVDSEKRRLEATGRVIFTGSIPYSRVPDLMRGFDVCVTPHVVTEFTESLNPIKLWEYLACGKPIVSTPVAGFREYPEYVRIASGAEEFLVAACDALNEPSVNSLRRRQEALNHSWQNRVQTIIEVLNGAQESHAARRRSEPDTTNRV